MDCLGALNQRRRYQIVQGIKADINHWLDGGLDVLDCFITPAIHNVSLLSYSYVLCLLRSSPCKPSTLAHTRCPPPPVTPPPSFFLHLRSASLPQYPPPSE